MLVCIFIGAPILILLMLGQLFDQFTSKEKSGSETHPIFIIAGLIIMCLFFLGAIKSCS